jgi:septal ring factor EnvC (AmiA/AmiB activator)
MSSGGRERREMRRERGRDSHRHNHLINHHFSPEIFANPRPLLSSESENRRILQIHDSHFRNSVLTNSMLRYAMVEQTENLVLEILRRMQSDIAEMKTDIRDLKTGQIEIRMQLHSMDGNVLRQERTMASLQVKVDRIETRLDFTDGSLTKSPVSLFSAKLD